MGTPVINSAQIFTGPGLLRVAPIGTLVPTFAVTASVFSHTWAAAWVSVGATDEGVTETHETSVETVEVAESFYPVRYVTTGKSGRLSCSLAQLSTPNFLLAMNAAAGAAAVTGTAGTTMTAITPPLAGAEVRYMLSWESVDTTEVLIAYQCFNGGSTAIPRRKGADKAVLPVEFNFEMPDITVAPVPFRRYLAGVKYAP